MGDDQIGGVRPSLPRWGWLGLVVLFLIVMGCGTGVEQSTGDADDASQEVASPAADESAADKADDVDNDVVETTEPDSGVSTTAVPKPEPVVEPTPKLVPADIDVSDTSYSVHIEPILERACASCHASGQAGASHFWLDDAGDAEFNAERIRAYVEEGAMPPWPASSLSPDFVGDQSLTPEELARIYAWAEDGGTIDVPSDTPVESTQAPSYLEDRDIVMTAAGGPYRHTSRTPDEYRCLVFEPGNEELEYIVGAHFEPDKIEIAHHAIVTLVSGKLRDQVAELEGRDEDAGWTCYGGLNFEPVEGGYTQRLGGWAPGGQPTRLPEGYAVPLTAGDFIIVQVHYHYDGTYPEDSSRYVLSLASDEEIEANAGWFKRFTGARYLGPAEIPCYEGDTEPLCDRDVALARVKNLYGDFIGGLPNFFLKRCGATPEDFAHMTNGDASSTCDLPVTNPGRIYSVTGHMHELGKSIRLTLNPDTPEERILLDIPDWDFEWQLGYQPVEDIIIDEDDVIRVDCSWNRERAPYEAVGYILWSDGTGDEMCYSGITTAPIE